MSFWGWTVLVLVAWVLLALVAGRLLGAMIKRRDAQHTPAKQAPHGSVPPGTGERPDR